MYKAIAIRLRFFTIATILGALWAAGSLGHLLAVGPEGNLGFHRVAQLRRLAARAAHQGPARCDAGLVGGDRPVVTAFAFVGVNMFLSGLHSYGSLWPLAARPAAFQPGDLGLTGSPPSGGLRRSGAWVARARQSRSSAPDRSASGSSPRSAQKCRNHRSPSAT